MAPERNPSRYSAHHALAPVGPAGQEAIAGAHVLLIGLGGLGCAAAQYLAASGIGQLTVCDFDTVAVSNLARQVLYRDSDVGRRKSAAALDALRSLNPDSRISARDIRMGAGEIAAELASADLVIDASDNYGTRLAVNRACLAAGKPWVMGSCVRMEGQLMLLSGNAGDACYRCVYGSAPDTLEDCPGAGIFAPVAGVIGTAMAHLALGHLSGSVAVRGLQVLDASRWSWHTIAVSKNPQCADCGAPSA